MKTPNNKNQTPSFKRLPDERTHILRFGISLEFGFCCLVVLPAAQSTNLTIMKL